MAKLILYVISLICAIAYNIIVLGTYSLHENTEFKNICLVLIIINMTKDAILFSIILSNIFLR